ncbi:unnamed protein product [Closterium sp. Yama58-4]|nr:unnamed protein product [Closterium sp. Yama58-4]
MEENANGLRTSDPVSIEGESGESGLSGPRDETRTNEGAHNAERKTDSAEGERVDGGRGEREGRGDGSAECRSEGSAVMAREEELAAGVGAELLTSAASQAPVTDTAARNGTIAASESSEAAFSVVETTQIARTSSPAALSASRGGSAVAADSSSSSAATAAAAAAVAAAAAPSNPFLTASPSQSSSSSSTSASASPSYSPPPSPIPSPSARSAAAWMPRSASAAPIVHSTPPLPRPPPPHPLQREAFAEHPAEDPESPPPLYPFGAAQAPGVLTFVCETPRGFAGRQEVKGWDAQGNVQLGRYMYFPKETPWHYGVDGTNYSLLDAQSGEPLPSRGKNPNQNQREYQYQLQLQLQQFGVPSPRYHHMPQSPSQSQHLSHAQSQPSLPQSQSLSSSQASQQPSQGPVSPLLLGCPLEVLDIGSAKRKVGESYPVRVLAALCVMEGTRQPKPSWKIVTIAATDPMADLMTRVSEVSKGGGTLGDVLRDVHRDLKALVNAKAGAL